MLTSIAVGFACSSMLNKVHLDRSLTDMDLQVKICENGFLESGGVRGCAGGQMMTTLCLWDLRFGALVSF